MALVMLIRYSTGEKWNSIMHELAVKNGDTSLPHSVQRLDLLAYEDLVENGLRKCGTALVFVCFAAIILIL